MPSKTKKPAAKSKAGVNKKVKYDLRTLTGVALNIIVKAGEAKSSAMMAIFAAKEKNFKEADEMFEQAEKQLVEAEKEHFELIQQEAQGVEIKIPLILMHAEDQLLSTQSIIILGKELVELRRELAGKK